MRRVRKSEGEGNWEQPGAGLGHEWELPLASVLKPPMTRNWECCLYSVKNGTFHYSFHVKNTFARSSGYRKRERNQFQCKVTCTRHEGTNNLLNGITERSLYRSCMRWACRISLLSAVYSDGENVSGKSRSPILCCPNPKFRVCPISNKTIHSIIVSPLHMHSHGAYSQSAYFFTLMLLMPSRPTDSDNFIQCTMYDLTRLSGYPVFVLVGYVWRSPQLEYLITPLATRLTVISLWRWNKQLRGVQPPHPRKFNITGDV